jgi:hypothetical protein
VADDADKDFAYASVAAALESVPDLITTVASPTTDPSAPASPRVGGIPRPPAGAMPPRIPAPPRRVGSGPTYGRPTATMSPGDPAPVVAVTPLTMLTALDAAAVGYWQPSDDDVIPSGNQAGNRRRGRKG